MTRKFDKSSFGEFRIFPCKNVNIKEHLNGIEGFRSYAKCCLTITEECLRKTFMSN
jgi:hypothetical protein